MNDKTGEFGERKCPHPKCGYTWTPRKPNPKNCPRCHRWLDVVPVSTATLNDEGGKE